MQTLVNSVQVQHIFRGGTNRNQLLVALQISEIALIKNNILGIQRDQLRILNLQQFTDDEEDEEEAAAADQKQHISSALWHAKIPSCHGP